MTEGIHHITAITGNIRKNLRFYTEILGLKLIKRTVNYDSPDTWHLYFGDSEGKPGGVITFFPFIGTPKGQSGNGAVKATGFSVGPNSLDFWMKRLREYQVPYRGPSRRFDEEFIVLQDFDGMELELVANANDQRPGRETIGIKGDCAIKGFYHGELSLSSTDKTTALLTGIMDHQIMAEENGRMRLFSGQNAPGSFIDLVLRPSMPAQRQGSGTVHHIAFSTADENSQLILREKIQKSGLYVSEVMDRQYFKSIYFREPGGVLFEIATLGPGFMIDETPDTLGQHLKLPSWLEPRREEIENALPDFD
jgi:glyoxalase family protein